MTDEPYNAAERADVREADKAARATQRQDEDVTRDIMRTAAGRAYLYRKLEACHIHHTTAVQGDAFATYFNEGQRSIGLMFEAEILRACPEEFILMLREANERDITSDTTRRNRRNNGATDHGNGHFVDYAADAVGDEAVDRDN